MTSLLKHAITSTLDYMRTIPYTWDDSIYGDGKEKPEPTKLLQKVLVWNDQVSRMAEKIQKDGGYLFACPAAFLELVAEDTTQVLENVTETNYCFRFHLVDMQLNALDEDTLDQNLDVIDYRDTLKTYMVGFQPDYCSTLFAVGEEQDYKHTNIYHYIIEMKCLFRDTKGSILDPDEVKVIYKEPDTNLELDLQIEN